MRWLSFKSNTNRRASWKVERAQLIVVPPPSCCYGFGPCYYCYVARRSACIKNFMFSSGTREYMGTSKGHARHNLKTAKPAAVFQSKTAMFQTHAFEFSCRMHCICNYYFCFRSTKAHNYREKRRFARWLCDLLVEGFRLWSSNFWLFTTSNRLLWFVHVQAFLKWEKFRYVRKL